MIGRVGLTWFVAMSGWVVIAGGCGPGGGGNDNDNGNIEFNCQIFCEDGEGTVVGGGIVVFEEPDVEEATEHCEEHIEEEDAEVVAACEEGTTPVSCTCVAAGGGGEDEISCQIVCRFPDNNVQGGAIVDFQASSVDAAAQECESEVALGNNQEILNACPVGSTPDACSCFDGDGG
jgi:hypothetical protein